MMGLRHDGAVWPQDHPRLQEAKLQLSNTLLSFGMPLKFRQSVDPEGSAHNMSFSQTTHATNDAVRRKG